MSPLETAAHPGYAQETAVEETLVTFDKLVTNELLLSYVKVGFLPNPSPLHCPSN